MMHQANATARTEDRRKQHALHSVYVLGWDRHRGTLFSHMFGPAREPPRIRPSLFL